MDLPWRGRLDEDQDVDRARVIYALDHSTRDTFTVVTVTRHVMEQEARDQITARQPRHQHHAVGDVSLQAETKISFATVLVSEAPSSQEAPF